MNLHQRLIAALTRVASASSVARQRATEAARASRRGDNAEVAARLEPIVSRFEALADEMEKALA